MEEAAASLGASPLTIFRRIVLPNLVPAILSGAALAFARAVGEFGSVVLISRQHAVRHPGRRRSTSSSRSRPTTRSGAAAVSVVLLAVSLFVLIASCAYRALGEPP